MGVNNMFKKKKDSNELINDALYVSDGIPLPEEEDLRSKKVKPVKEEKAKRPRKKAGFFSKFFRPKFRKGKGLDGF